MAIIECYECKNSVSDKASACPHCGAPISNSLKNTDIQLLLKEFLEKSHVRSKNIFIDKEITEKILKPHTNKYVKMKKDEKILLVLNKSRMIIPFSGITVTSKRIHYYTIKKSFFSSIVPRKGMVGCIDFEKLNSVSIGSHDSCFGTAYVGHEFLVNGNVLGYIRMGSGILYDDKAIDFLNNFFAFLLEKLKN